LEEKTRREGFVVDQLKISFVPVATKTQRFARNCNSDCKELTSYNNGSDTVPSSVAGDWLLLTS